MGNNLFRPGDAKYGRTIQVISVYSCTLVGFHAMMADHGRHEHIFTPFQRYFYRKLDNYFMITDEELSVPPTPKVRPEITPGGKKPQTNSPSEPGKIA